MPTLKQKVQKYEELLHKIQMAAVVTMDRDRLAKLIEQICAWSYAHRSGNGELTIREQKTLINKAFDNLGT